MVDYHIAFDIIQYNIVVKQSIVHTSNSNRLRLPQILVIKTEHIIFGHMVLEC